jgi:hypothetical protein
MTALRPEAQEALLRIKLPTTATAAVGTAPNVDLLLVVVVAPAPLEPGTVAVKSPAANISPAGLVLGPTPSVANGFWTSPAEAGAAEG